MLLQRFSKRLLDLKERDLLSELEDTARRLPRLGESADGASDSDQASPLLRGQRQSILPSDLIAFESKVFRPLLSDRIKQGHPLACQRIYGCRPVGLMQIASGACQGEVFQSGLAALRLRYDMFDVKMAP
jgi:hypothetical protein